MVLATSFSIGGMKTEFGSTNNNLGGYYRTASSLTRGVPGVPASGTISMSSFQNKGAPKFTISPAVSGITNWDLRTNGDLALTAGGDWTITLSNGPIYSLTKIWGGAGGTCYLVNSGTEASGGGGYASGYCTLNNGTSYPLWVAGGGVGAVAVGLGGAGG